MASVKQAWIERYGEEEGLQKWKALNAGKGTLEWYVNKYGKEEGESRYYQKNKKLSISYEALKLNGKSEEEIEKIRKTHREKSKQTLENMINRYGDVNGPARYREYREKNKLSSNRTLDYWLKRYDNDKEKAVEAYKAWQRRDKKWYVLKYGPVDGLERYEKANKKKGRTLENYINKYGPEKGLQLYDKACTNWMNGQRTVLNSKGQLEVEEFLRSVFADVKGYKEEIGILLEEQDRTELLTNHILYPDIIVNGKYIVEYNGDFWHAHERIFADSTVIVPRVEKTVEDIRMRDQQKIDFFKKKGFTTIVIWDSDWWVNKETIKTQLVNIIKETI